MKKQKVETTEYVLSVKEMKLIKICLDYAYHRIAKHETSGLRGIINEVDLTNLREEL